MNLVRAFVLLDIWLIRGTQSLIAWCKSESQGTCCAPETTLVTFVSYMYTNICTPLDVLASKIRTVEDCKSFYLEQITNIYKKSISNISQEGKETNSLMPSIHIAYCILPLPLPAWPYCLPTLLIILAMHPYSFRGEYVGILVGYERCCWLQNLQSKAINQCPQATVRLCGLSQSDSNERPSPNVMLPYYR